MKLTLLALITLHFLPSCTTTTTTLPDGTVIVTKGVDRDSVIAVSGAAIAVTGSVLANQLETTSGK